jgi:hypothetical protein
MVLGRFRRLGVWRPGPRDQCREDSISEPYDYLDHRADPITRVLCGGYRRPSRRKFDMGTEIPNFWEVVWRARLAGPEGLD